LKTGGLCGKRKILKKMRSSDEGRDSDCKVTTHRSIARRYADVNY
jgi:hypothetical protein